MVEPRIARLTRVGAAPKSGDARLCELSRRGTELARDDALGTFVPLCETMNAAPELDLRSLRDLLKARRRSLLLVLSQRPCSEGAGSCKSLIPKGLSSET